MMLFQQKTTFVKAEQHKQWETDHGTPHILMTNGLGQSKILIRSPAATDYGDYPRKSPLDGTVLDSSWVLVI